MVSGWIQRWDEGSAGWVYSDVVHSTFACRPPSLQNKLEPLETVTSSMFMNSNQRKRTKTKITNQGREKEHCSAEEYNQVFGVIVKSSVLHIKLISFNPTLFNRTEFPAVSEARTGTSSVLVTPRPIGAAPRG